MSARLTHLRTGPSSINGTGLFAVKPIRRGERIGEYMGPPATRNGKYVMWKKLDDGKWEARSGRNILRYANHSKDPNAEAIGFEFYALKDIAPGNEITFDYTGGYDEDQEADEDWLK